MLFWTRAVLCIGTLTVVAVRQQPPAAVPRGPVPSMSEVAAAACRARPDACAAALKRGWEVLTPAQSESRKPGHASATVAPVANASRSLT